MESIETLSLGNLTARIIQDEHAESPDMWSNEDCFLVYDHRQFTVERKGFDPQDIFEHLQVGHKIYEGYWAFPVYAYIHSGVALSLGKSGYPFTCQFDTSMRGFVLVKRQKGWSYTNAKAYAVAESVVNEWNQYLSGDVYGYVIEDTNGDELDSCWGFYGLEYVKNEADSLLKYHLGQQFKRRIETVKTLIKNRVPLYLRESKILNA